MKGFLYSSFFAGKRQEGQLPCCLSSDIPSFLQFLIMIYCRVQIFLFQQNSYAYLSGLLGSTDEYCGSIFIMLFCLFLIQDKIVTKQEILDKQELFVKSKATNYGETLKRPVDELWIDFDLIYNRPKFKYFSNTQESYLVYLFHVSVSLVNTNVGCSYSWKESANNFFQFILEGIKWSIGVFEYFFSQFKFITV